MNVKKEGCMLIFENEEGNEVRYDLKRQQLQKFKNRSWHDVSNQYLFFKDLSVDELKFNDTKFKELIETVKKCNPGCKNVSTFITKIEECLVYESFIQEGVLFELYVDRRRYYGGYEVRGVTRPLTDYDRNVIKFFKAKGIKLTHGFEEEYFKNPSIHQSIVHDLQVTELTKEQLQEALRFIYDHWNYKEKFKALTVTHRFSTKSLLEYIYNYLLPFEGLTFDKAVDELLDYANMALEMGREVKKYPKYLRSMHDIIRANYNSYKRDYDENMFSLMARKELEYNDETYAIVLPGTTKDIVKEGTSLNHCVSSYGDKILRGETYICFLRLKKEVEQSLITVEVRGDKVVQAKGSYNRSMNEKEKAFLNKFARVKKLQMEIA